MEKKALHKNNIHNKGYDFKVLQEKYPKIKEFVIEKYGKETIDFSNPKAVKEFNKALLSVYYNIKTWEFSDDNLCPPIPGRVDYIHYLADLIGKEKEVTVLDIGTGATCIYPLLGNAVYNWNFVASDIDLDSLDSAQDIIDDNNLDAKIKLRQQFKEEHVLKGILEKEDSFTVTMCNPPFYKSAEEARGANRRKSRNLGNNAVRNFSGNSNELWYIGGEKAFLHTYLYESSQYPTVSKWFTSLVSKKENVESLQKSGKKLGVKEFKVIPMTQGNKVTRIVCWRF
ncbi:MULTISPECIES: 23S rRNA (adenine(1618)-N(6))-methyltransferase RlmF [unclassified Tenacibaculum]|uniref:23S rRNA (adenine(1618)-N(6))-methyltransferase RlmF n=1 Tax=unclassified Tenacibaculum TaxID=2635139 RepID=UPI001F3E6F77|nr:MULTISPECIES: 23S rRNA (adenine(1618)-N(6))-methyltransferase RlmF [unclassified Tenacibaculum]MCF2873083.1 23S rRNA (adenine(1618)-N(6))-methyltransferase RlmF [Tenacibaculum sp. Cn5-1]MCF2933239.1 23S rRNA (adenine(1618)-N(6))-methyltransferase RlmF [Tenacibaculum sp. Cn5-34]MCG7510180.1 23S rRNA (adenine(1618)-N(6))-methyltransferase RlmF [Tenacibaculum sp. Cn5-46]